MEYGLLTFSSSHDALSAQKCLEGRVSFQIMPVLRAISASCGISVRFDLDELQSVRDILRQNEHAPEHYRLYSVHGSGSSLQIIPL